MSGRTQPTSIVTVAGLLAVLCLTAPGEKGAVHVNCLGAGLRYDVWPRPLVSWVNLKGHSPTKGSSVLLKQIVLKRYGHSLDRNVHCLNKERKKKTREGERERERGGGGMQKRQKKTITSKDSTLILRKRQRCELERTRAFPKYFDIIHHPEISYASPLMDLALVVESSHMASEGLETATRLQKE